MINSWLLPHSWMIFYQWIDKHYILTYVWRTVLFRIEYFSFTLFSAWWYIRDKKIQFIALKSDVLIFFHKIKTIKLFLKAAICHQEIVGAILPSSKQLAKKMASYVSVSPDELVVELGAGTGVITQALLNRGVKAEQLIAIEWDNHLVKELQIRFPGVTIVQGNAACLKEILHDQTKRVGAVVSGLPLRRLPEEMVQRILSSIPQVSSPSGQFIQFTYDIRNQKGFYPENYHFVNSKIVWLNIPPAKVSLYQF